MKENNMIFPSKINKLIKGLKVKEITDYHVSKDAVYNIENTYILKISNNIKQLQHEKEMNDFLLNKLPVCKTILFEIYDNKAYYLKSYIDGEPLCIEKYLSDPIKLAKLLAKAMNMVHLKYDGKTFVHGDFCLPNILVKDDEIVGIIDTCHAEFNDPWIDYAWCIWSYEYNLKTNIYTPILLKELNIEFDLEKYNKYIKNDDRI